MKCAARISVFVEVAFWGTETSYQRAAQREPNMSKNKLVRVANCRNQKFLENARDIRLSISPIPLAGRFHDRPVCVPSMKYFREGGAFEISIKPIRLHTERSFKSSASSQKQFLRFLDGDHTAIMDSNRDESFKIIRVYLK